MKRLFALLSLAAVFLGGCGSASPGSAAGAPSDRTAVGASRQPVTSTPPFLPIVRTTSTNTGTGATHALPLPVASLDPTPHTAHQEAGHRAPLLGSAPPTFQLLVTAATTSPVQAVTGFFPMPLANIDTTALPSLLPGVYRTAHLTIHYRPNGFWATTIVPFARGAEDALASDEAALGVTLAGHEDIYLANRFFLPPASGAKGYTLSNARTILLMCDGSGTALERQFMVAHELTHQLAYDGIGAASSVMLSEGLAMDLEQRYLRANGDISLDGFVRAALGQGDLVPLASLSADGGEFGGQFFHRRAYDEAGSFVHFLIARSGLPRFERLYTSGDYSGVYGVTLPALQAEWLDYLQSNRALGPFAPHPAVYYQDIERVQRDYAALFSMLLQGSALSAAAYQALDTSRVASDQGAHGVVEALLPAVEHTLGVAPQ